MGGVHLRQTSESANDNTAIEIDMMDAIMQKIDDLLPLN